MYIDILPPYDVIVYFMSAEFHESIFLTVRTPSSYINIPGVSQCLGCGGCLINGCQIKELIFPSLPEKDEHSAFSLT